MAQTYAVHVVQIVEQDYEVKASSYDEAKRIAEAKYHSGEFDPINDDGDISHQISVREMGE